MLNTTPLANKVLAGRRSRLAAGGAGGGDGPDGLWEAAATDGDCSSAWLIIASGDHCTEGTTVGKDGRRRGEEERRKGKERKETREDYVRTNPFFHGNSKDAKCKVKQRGMERAGRWTDEWWKKKEDAINGNHKRANERENERASCGKKEANDQRRSGGCRKRYDGGGDYKGMEHTSCKVHLSPRFGCGGRHFDRVCVWSWEQGVEDAEMVCLGARKEGREDKDVSLSKTRDHDCVNFSIQSNRTHRRLRRTRV